MRTIYHLHIVRNDIDQKDFYYGSIAAMVSHQGAALHIGIDALYKFDWSKTYDNGFVIIRKSKLLTPAAVKRKRTRTAKR